MAPHLNFSFPDSDESAFYTGSSRRRSTFPGAHIARQKPRRWPLVLRITKGSVHANVLLPILLHGIFTALIVAVDQFYEDLGLPSSITTSLSIVVGLMLVFRNGTGYDRFWSGRACLNNIVCGVRSLARYFLVYDRDGKDERTSDEHVDTERVVRYLMALLYAVKSHLRAEYVGVTDAPGTPYPQSPRARSPTPWRPSGNAAEQDTGRGQGNGSGLHSSASFTNFGTAYVAPLASSISTLHPMYSGLLPPGLGSLEDQGLPLPLQIAVPVESYIRRGVIRGWWGPPQAGYLSGQLSGLLMAWGQMETIRTTPTPVAHLIHARQVLALYLLFLPFALVDEMGWWAVPIVSLVAFTLYGIEAIGTQLEDPFGYDKNDIKMDAIVEDAKIEVEALLDEWLVETGRQNGSGTERRESALFE